MVEMIKEKLFYTAQQNIGSIDKTVEAIEKALEKLLVLRDTEIQLSTAFADASQHNVETSADAKIALLRKLREELLEDKENNLLLLREFERFLHSDGRYPGGHGTVCVTVDPLVEQANRCEAAAQRFSEKANKASFKAKSIFDDESMIEESIEILRCVDGYETTSRDLMNICQEASNTFRKMSDSYASCAAAIGTGLSDLFEERRQKEETLIQKQSTVAPPIQASYSKTTIPPARQEERRRPDIVETPSKNNSKRSFLGFFKGKKKNDLTSAGESVSPPRIDSVQFSAVAPSRVVPGKYLPINIVMYEDAFRKTVDDIIRSHEEGAKESKSGYQDVERNSLIKVTLTSPDVVIEDGEEEQKWAGKYLDFEFAAKIPNDFAEEQILFSATVYINDLIATKLKLILDCERKPKRNVTVTREDVVSAFVSYASQDRSRVAAIIQGMKKARPDMDIFFDIESLRSGQKWEEALKSEISNRDILFLCWSKFARDSKWVDMEWRYALESKGEECIEPIPIDSPDVCPPPVELQQKHFNDRMLYIIKATAQIEGGRPCLIRSKTSECMTIDKPMVRIGKQREYVDLFIGENAAISRNHANIIEREGQYYIVDTNSVNHTYVDGRQIPSNVETIIHFGAKIRLADEEFEFVCK